MTKNNLIPRKLIDLILLKLKFAGSSSIATAVDYCLYQILVLNGFSPAKANLISAGHGLVINFILQKKYIFDLNRKLESAFFISFFSSLLGLVLSTFIIHHLSQIDFFSNNQFITKAIVTGLLFFYNFYMKRFAFEKRLV